MAVANVMHPDLLYSNCVTGPCHNMIYDVLCIGENPIILLQSVPLLHILPEAVHQERRDRDHTVALGCLGRGDHFLTIDILVILIDTDSRFVKINVCRGQSQHLTFPDASVVQCHKHSVILRLL